MYVYSGDDVILSCRKQCRASIMYLSFEKFQVVSEGQLVVTSLVFVVDDVFDVRQLVVTSLVFEVDDALTLVVTSYRRDVSSALCR